MGSVFRRKGVFLAEDLEAHAKRRLPGFVFDFVDGAAERERAKACSRAAFEAYRLMPRIPEQREPELGCELFGEAFAAPFGIAPIGLAGLIAPGTDLRLASTAAEMEIPYVASAAAQVSVLEIAEATGRPPWFQLYLARDPAVTRNMIDRAIEAGVRLLIVTVDALVPGKRVRDLRNRFHLPLRPTPKMLFDLVFAPDWTMRHFLGGAIGFPNFEDARSEKRPIEEIMAEQVGGRLDWQVISHLRDIWPGKLVLKGILSVEDAKRANALGVDGIIVSNHGGRQLDAAPAPLTAVGPIRRALPNVPLMVDSGVRSGSDIVCARHAGADGVLIGRPFLWALAAFGKAGLIELVEMFIDELRDTLRLCGSIQPRELRS